MKFCRELKSFCKINLPGVFQKGFMFVLSLIFSLRVYKWAKVYGLNAISLGKTSLILIAMSKNTMFLQKVLKDLLRLPERQELFPGRVNPIATGLLIIFLFAWVKILAIWIFQE